MSKYVAYGPNGTAYHCDTLAEVRKVEGHKRKNGDCGWRKRNPRKNGDCGCGKRRNPSEDYTLGLFQGAMEHGKLPPPKDASTDFRRGYTDGYKVGRSKPEARAQALGVFKGTGSQRQGGEALYELSQGLSTVANPATTKAIEAIDADGKPFLIPYFEKAGPFVRSTTLTKGETPETVKDDFTAGTITHLPTRGILYRAYSTRYSSAKDKAKIAMKACERGSRHSRLRRFALSPRGSLRTHGR